MLSIASSQCILTVSRDFYPKIRRRLGTETTRLGAATAATLRSTPADFFLWETLQQKLHPQKI